MTHSDRRRIAMPLFTPYIGKSADRLVALINADNNTALQAGQEFEFGQPEEDAKAPDGRNTKVTLIPMPDSLLYDRQDVYYWRLDISALERLPLGSTRAIEAPPVPFSTHDVLPQLNDALGLELVPAEVEDITYTTIDDAYPLTIAPSSYAWVVSTYMFKVIHPESLGGTFRNATFDAFDYVRPDLP
ncbi:DUF7941 domain-family protein [Paraburkholderia sediminicola]|uniref:DUF7941 domain-family protein n=1 Tax=Paraburkholderia sediminicola TaxID=458836 RepID=UPI0038BA5C58